MYPARWRITSFLQPRAGNAGCEMADFLDPAAPSLPRALKAAGYATAHFGKWHLGWDWETVRRAGAIGPLEKTDRVFAPDAFDWKRRIPGGPLAHGFDRYAGDDVTSAQLVALLDSVPSLKPIVSVFTGGDESPAIVASAVEFVLEGLHLSKRLNKDSSGPRATYRSKA